MSQLPFTYILKNHHNAKRVTIRISRDGSVVVTKPIRVSKAYADQVVIRTSAWIQEKIAHIHSLPKLTPAPSRTEYIKLKEQAYTRVIQIIQRVNQSYGLTYNTIFIKNQKTRWGSCSSKKNLQFNYRIALLEPELAEYIVVHELCHVKEMNHGPKFWHLVAQTIPDYVERHKALRKKGLLLS